MKMCARFLVRSAVKEERFRHKIGLHFEPAEPVLALWRCARGGVLPLASRRHRRVEFFQGLGPDETRATLACTGVPPPAQWAKSSTDMWAVPAGPAVGGLSALGPPGKDFSFPSTTMCGSGACPAGRAILAARTRSTSAPVAQRAARPSAPPRVARSPVPSSPR